MILPVFPLHLSELMGREARYVFGFWSGGLDTIRCTRPLVLRMVVTALVWDTPVISSSFTYKTESQSVSIQSQKIHRKSFLYFVANYLQNVYKKKMLFVNILNLVLL